MFAAMQEAYQTLHSRQEDAQSTLIVLTDGAPSDDELLSQVVKLKGDVNTIFIWLGKKSPQAENLFSPLADNYADDPQSALQHLDQYLSVYSTAVKMQSVLTVTE